MGRKIVCESCGTEFKFEVAKDFEECPVCGKSFDDEVDVEDNATQIENSGDDVMYFDEIATSYEKPEYNGVCAYCMKCKGSNHLVFDKVDKVVDKKYVILKEGVTVKCKYCGKEHKPRKIMYKQKAHYAPPLPRCPVCNSAMLKKIKTSSKFLAAATIGTFALPYNSKTFECKDCGYRF